MLGGGCSVLRYSTLGTNLEGKGAVPPLLVPRLVGAFWYSLALGAGIPLPPWWAASWLVKRKPRDGFPWRAQYQASWRDKITNV